MDRSEKRHQKDIQKHVDYQTMKLRKQAGKLRRSLKKTKGGGGKPVTEENWEQVVGQRKTRGRPSRDELVHELRDSSDETPAQSSDVDKNAAIVIFVASGRCRVFQDGQEIDCIIPPEVAVRQQSALAVGDRVQLDENRAVKAVLPRRTVLSRPDPNNPHRQRLIAANLDIVIHVVSVKAPPLRPRLIDRFFIAIQRGGAQPLLCVNKIDLMSDEQELAQLEPYRELMPVVLCSSLQNELPPEEFRFEDGVAVLRWQGEKNGGGMARFDEKTGALAELSATELMGEGTTLRMHRKSGLLEALRHYSAVTPALLIGTAHFSISASTNFCR